MTEENIINAEKLNLAGASNAKRVKKLYAIFDRQRMAYLAIMEKPNHAVALRDFDSIAKDKSGLVNRYPEDFAMYYLGTMDEETGELTSEKQKIGEAKDYIGEKENG